MASTTLYYVGDAGRYYPTLGLEPKPGNSYDIDDPHDGRWSTTASGEPTTSGPAAELPAEVTA